ncbi:MAG: PAS domain S-box protein [FCB group bacterium]|nr:PAS domain S-box protein [FCB group bacterium]
MSRNPSEILENTPTPISILIVEDETELLNLLSKGLKRYSRHYEICTADSSDKALKLLQTTQFDILITDIKMAGMDGLELAREGKILQPELQSVVITGHTDLDTVIEALRSGAINYFQKPISIKALHMTIDSIMEKRKLEKLLIDNEEKYRTLTNNLNIGVFRTSSGEKGKFLEVNPAMLKIFRYTEKSEFLSLNVSDVYLKPEKRTEINNLLIRDGSVKDLEVELIKKDGQVFTGLTSSTAIKDDTGKVIYFDGHIEDITEKKKNSLRLKESEERYRNLFELSPDAIVVHHQNKIVFANPASLVLIGADFMDQVIGRDIYEFVHPEFKKLVAKRVKDTQTRKKTIAPLVEKFIRLDGEEIMVEVKGMPFTYRGEPATQLVISDITDRVRTEDELNAYRVHLQEIIEERTQELEESRKQIKQERDLFLEGPVAIIKWEKDNDNPTRILYVSPNITNLGVSVKDVLTHRINIWQLVHPEDYPVVKEETRDFMQNSREFMEQEFRVILPDGKILWLHYSIRSHLNSEDPGHRMYHSYIIDITEQKKLQKLLEEKQEQLAFSQRMASLGKMAAGVAHELNQPLAIIRAQTEIMKITLDKNQRSISDFHQDTDVIIEEVDRAAEIIDSLRKFASGSDNPDETYDITSLFDRTLIFFSKQFQNRNIQLLTQCEENLPGVSVNSTRFQQVILNVVSNARDAVEKREKNTITEYSKSVNLHLACTEDRQQVQLKVIDNGIGMSDDEMAHCFEPFYSTKEVGEGPGLGLSIVHGIVKEFNGTIDVDSEIGSGTTVTISMPIYKG